MISTSKMVPRWCLLRDIPCLCCTEMLDKVLGTFISPLLVLTEHFPQLPAIITFGTALDCLMLATWCSQSECPSVRLQDCLSYEYSFRGPTTTQFLEWITPSSLTSLKPYSSTLSVILNEAGGIIDDTVVTKHAADAFYVVTNAGRRDRDLAWFKDKLAEWNASERAKDGKVELEVLEDWGLVALQGACTCFIGSFRPI